MPLRGSENRPLHFYLVTRPCRHSMVDDFWIALNKQLLTECIKRGTDAGVQPKSYRYLLQCIPSCCMCIHWWWNRAIVILFQKQRSIRSRIADQQPEIEGGEPIISAAVLNDILSAWQPNEILDNDDGTILLHSAISLEPDTISWFSLFSFSQSICSTSPDMWWEIYFAALVNLRTELTKSRPCIDVVNSYILPRIWKNAPLQNISERMRMNAITMHEHIDKGFLFHRLSFWEFRLCGSIRIHWLLKAVDILSADLLNNAFSEVMRTTHWQDVEPAHLDDFMRLPFHKVATSFAPFSGDQYSSLMSATNTNVG